MIMDDEKITDLDIQALVDDELDPERQRLVMDYIQSSPDLYKRYTLYVHQKKLLKSWWRDN
jgi:anti-sigma factor RsiW